MILQRRVVYRRRQDGNTRIYLAGTDSLEVVPTGVGNVAISAYGGGGGGGHNLGLGGGGGGGAYCYKFIAVTPGDTFIFTVGRGGDGRLSMSSGNGSNGTSSTVTGNVLGGSVNLVAGYGETTRGTGSTSYPGYGGIATGGDDNIPGANALAQLGGDGAGPRGGQGGIIYPGTVDTIYPPTEFGGGGHGQRYFIVFPTLEVRGPFASANGVGGMVMFDYTP